MIWPYWNPPRRSASITVMVRPSSCKREPLRETAKFSPLPAVMAVTAMPMGVAYSALRN